MASLNNQLSTMIKKKFNSLLNQFIEGMSLEDCFYNRDSNTILTGRVHVSELLYNNIQEVHITSANIHCKLLV